MAIPIAFWVVGAWVAYLGSVELMRAKESIDWPSVNGEVTVSRISMGSGSDGKGSVYGADVRYTYAVDGERYEGSRVAYGDHQEMGRSYGETLVSRYPEGAMVTVFYMPGDPSESLLEPGQNKDSVFKLGFGVAFLLFGTVFFFKLGKVQGEGVEVKG